MSRGACLIMMSFFHILYIWWPFANISSESMSLILLLLSSNSYISTNKIISNLVTDLVTDELLVTSSSWLTNYVTPGTSFLWIVLLGNFIELGLILIILGFRLYFVSFLLSLNFIAGILLISKITFFDFIAFQTCLAFLISSQVHYQCWMKANFLLSLCYLWDSNTFTNYLFSWYHYYLKLTSLICFVCHYFLAGWSFLLVSDHKRLSLYK